MKPFIMNVRLVTMVTLLIAMSLPTDSALIQSKTFFHRPDLADEVFSEGLLFQTLARSNLDCLWLCSSTQSCLSYTYTTSNATRGRFACRGHTSVMSAQFPSVFAPGARTFVSTTDVQQGAGGCKAGIQQCTVIRATGIQQCGYSDERHTAEYNYWDDRHPAVYRYWNGGHAALYSLWDGRQAAGFRRGC